MLITIFKTTASLILSTNEFVIFVASEDCYQNCLLPINPEGAPRPSLLPQIIRVMRLTHLVFADGQCAGDQNGVK